MKFWLMCRDKHFTAWLVPDLWVETVIWNMTCSGLVSKVISLRYNVFRICQEIQPLIIPTSSFFQGYEEGMLHIFFIFSWHNFVFRKINLHFRSSYFSLVVFIFLHWIFIWCFNSIFITSLKDVLSSDIKAWPCGWLLPVPS